MNKKGQALVEFILILPVFLMILFVIIDFGMIFSSKNELEDISTLVVDMIKNKEDINSIKSMYDDIDINIVENDKYYDIYIEKDVKLITPGLNRILDNPYRVEIKRVVYNES